MAAPNQIIVLLECLLDTAQRTTELENIYCDINDQYINNQDALALYMDICREANHEPLTFDLPKPDHWSKHVVWPRTVGVTT